MNTLEIATETLQAHGLDFDTIHGKDTFGDVWSALIVTSPSGDVWRIYSGDVESELVIAEADRWGSPTGNKVEVHGQNAEMLRAILGTTVAV